MADERKQASILPWPGGDLGVYTAGVIASTALNAIVCVGIAL